MTQRASAKGKWLAVGIVVLGLLAGLAEWKFRVVRVNRGSPTTMPAR